MILDYDVKDPFLATFWDINQRVRVESLKDQEVVSCNNLDQRLHKYKVWESYFVNSVFIAARSSKWLVLVYTCTQGVGKDNVFPYCFSCVVP